MQRFFVWDCRSPALPRASLQKNRKLPSLRFPFCFLQILLNANIQAFSENKNSEAKASLLFAERGEFRLFIAHDRCIHLIIA